jgi:hypothetical protein
MQFPVNIVTYILTSVTFQNCPKRHTVTKKILLFIFKISELESNIFRQIKEPFLSKLEKLLYGTIVLYFRLSVVHSISCYNLFCADIYLFLIEVHLSQI